MAWDIVEHQEEFSNLRHWTECWSHAWQTAPGCIDLRLDDLLQTDDDRQMFLNLLTKMAEREGDEISDVYLNRIIENWAPFRGGYPLFRHLKTLMLLEWLVLDQYTLPWLPTNAVQEINTRKGFYISQFIHYQKYESTGSFLGDYIVKEEVGFPLFRSRDGTRRIRVDRASVNLEVFSPGFVFPLANNHLSLTAGDKLPFARHSGLDRSGLNRVGRSSSGLIHVGVRSCGKDYSIFSWNGDFDSPVYD